MGKAVLWSRTWELSAFCIQAWMLKWKEAPQMSPVVVWGWGHLVARKGDLRKSKLKDSLYECTHKECRLDPRICDLGVRGLLSPPFLSERHSMSELPFYLISCPPGVQHPHAHSPISTWGKLGHGNAGTFDNWCPHLHKPANLLSYVWLPLYHSPKLGSYRYN